VVLTGRSVASTTTTVPDDLERWLDTSSLTDLEVLGDDGNRIGYLLDARFDQDTLGVQAFLLRATFWERLLGRRGQIKPDQVHACSRELMIVATDRLKEAKPAPTTASPELGVPLKVEDRLATPSYAGSEDGQPVSPRAD
jgi:sporulation protein YlmC with PRC-barrel domain